MARNQRKYNTEYKVQAVKLSNEIGSSKAAVDLRIPVDTLYGWVKAAKEGRLDIGGGAHTPQTAMSLAEELNSKATLEVVGRDQPDQRLYLSKDQESLVWVLDHAEDELWKQPPDPVLEAVAKIVSADNREWEGSPTELAQAIQTDMAVNRLTKHLNVNASRLLEEHQVRYENKTKHAGRRIRLTYMMVEAPAFEVIE